MVCMRMCVCLCLRAVLAHVSLAQAKCGLVKKLGYLQNYTEMHVTKVQMFLFNMCSYIPKSIKDI